jgi:hypothetical protein
MVGLRPPDEHFEILRNCHPRCCCFLLQHLVSFAANANLLSSALWVFVESFRDFDRRYILGREVL